MLQANRVVTCLRWREGRNWLACNCLEASVTLHVEFKVSIMAKRKTGSAKMAQEQGGARAVEDKLTTDTEAELPAPPAATAASFPVVGIGASAGGLAAFEAFFSGIPTDTNPNMAFVLVQHQI